MQSDGNSVQIGVEKVRVCVQSYLGRLVFDMRVIWGRWA
jgi:hypothetical protein